MQNTGDVIMVTDAAHVKVVNVKRTKQVKDLYQLLVKRVMATYVSRTTHSMYNNIQWTLERRILV